MAEGRLSNAFRSQSKASCYCPLKICDVRVFVFFADSYYMTNRRCQKAAEKSHAFVLLKYLPCLLRTGEDYQKAAINLALLSF
jgi:hypothetical protein